MSIFDLNQRNSLRIAESVVSIQRPSSVNYANTINTGQLANTTLTANALTSATSLTVASIAGFRDGDGITIILDTGGLHNTTVNGTPSGSTINIDDAMPSQASSGKRVELAITEVALARSGQSDLNARLAPLSSVYHVAHYGGDVQTAIDAAYAGGGKAVVALENGKEYEVGISGSGRALTLRQGISIQGNHATIKLENSAGNYETILGDATFGGVDLSSISIRDLIIDQNATNNQVTSTGQLAGANGRNAIRIGSGKHINIENVVVKDFQSVNTIVINGTTIEDISITDCKFYDCGGAAVDFDHSTIYVHAAVGRAVVHGNTFKAASIFANGARTAVEMHGSDWIVGNNEVYGYMIGIIATGVAASDSRSNIVLGNTMRDVRYGTILYSQQYTGHTTGYGIDNMIVAANTVYLADPSLWGSGLAAGGIMVDPNADLPIRNLKITDNIIFAPLETVLRTDNDASLGIGAYSVNLIDIEGLSVQDNIIGNMPLAGIRWSVGDLSDAKISGNIITNAGSTLDTGRPDAYRAGVVVIATTIKGCDIDNNQIIDNQSTSRMKYGIYCDATTSAAEFNIRWNTIAATGVTKTSLLYQVCPGTITPKPYLVGNINGWIIPATWFAEGSEVMDNGRKYRNSDGAASWPSESWGTGAPTTGYWDTGSTLNLRGPVPSGIRGYICTTAGTPGTWNMWGTIAA